MGYAQQESIEMGLLFKTRSGLVVKTTGATTLVDAHNIYVHEVVIVEGQGVGYTFLHNLDAAEAV